MLLLFEFIQSDYLSCPLMNTKISRLPAFEENCQDKDEEKSLTFASFIHQQRENKQSRETFSSNSNFRLIAYRL